MKSRIISCASFCATSLTLISVMLLSCTPEPRYLPMEEVEGTAIESTSGDATGEEQKKPSEIIPPLSREEVANYNFQIEASQDFFAAVASEWSQHQLALQPLVRTIPVDALVYSLATKFQLNDGTAWKSPRTCETRAEVFANCLNAATEPYCKSSSRFLDELYCQLGGEDRSVISSVLREWTTGDLVLLFEFSRKFCSIPETPVRLGLGSYVSRSIFFNALIPKLLTISESSPDYAAEKEFIETTFLNPQYQTSDVLKQEGQSLDTKFASVFQQTCSYLLVHPRQLSY